MIYTNILIFPTNFNPGFPKLLYLGNCLCTIFVIIIVIIFFFFGKFKRLVKQFYTLTYIKFDTSQFEEYTFTNNLLMRRLSNFNEITILRNIF